MIIQLQDDATTEERAQLLSLLHKMIRNLSPITTVQLEKTEVIVLDGKALPPLALETLTHEAAVNRIIPITTPYKLASKAFKQKTIVPVGEDRQVVEIGGDQPIIIAGPCAVESRDQLLDTALAVKKAGANILRGGAYKPRTSPYQFQGLQIEGLKILAEAREITGLPVITEVLDTETVEVVAEYADILQIGARNVQNFSLLKAAGRNSLKRPIMLKRGFSTTIDEWLLAAEYILATGNPNVILCERGVRSFEPHTRNMLDLACIPLLEGLTHLPVVVDPSHATGKRELVPAMSRAAVVAGAAGIILETHIDPEHALCDGRQSITPQQLEVIIHEALLLNRVLSETGLLTYVA